MCLSKETIAKLAVNDDLGRPVALLSQYDVQFENRPLAGATQSLHDQMLMGHPITEAFATNPGYPEWVQAFLSDHIGSPATLAMFEEWLDLLESEAIAT